MPVQPEYEKTLRVYQYLRERAYKNGLVEVPLRQIAKDLGYSSWSVGRVAYQTLGRGATHYHRSFWPCQPRAPHHDYQHGT